jgi:nucleoside-diphosphate-sugar epimerase
MIRCGITGHTGVLGKNIIDFFNFNFIKFNGDIRSSEDVDDWIKNNKFDIIIHLAAIVPVKTVESDHKNALEVNYNGTKNLVRSINKNNIKLKWFFFSSTSHVYKIKKKPILIDEKSKKSPYSAYGKTKLYAENYINKYLNKKYRRCIGRIFSFTDKKQSEDYFIPSIKLKIKKNKIYFYNTNHYRDFIDINDICSAMKRLWLLKANGTYNIGTGIGTNLNDIITTMYKRSGKVPIFKNRNIKTSYLIANIKKIKALGWSPKNKINDVINKYLN